jgi:predicted metal-binding protein
VSGEAVLDEPLVGSDREGEHRQRSASQETCQHAVVSTTGRGVPGGLVMTEVPTAGIVFATPLDACNPARTVSAACLSICFRCKPEGWRGEDNHRPGSALAGAIADEARRRGLNPDQLRDVRCMSQCKRPCVVAFSGEGRFTYLFGDLDPMRDASAVLDAFNLYSERTDGFMERFERPEALQAGILGRVPPLIPGARQVERWPAPTISTRTTLLINQRTDMTSRLAVTRRSALVLAASATAAAGMPTFLRAQDAGVLRVASPWEWTSNEPTDTGYIMARMQIAEALVMAEPDGKLVGGIAESWAVSEDKLTWRFKIRSGVVFHDGTPITAEAAAASLGRSLAGESMQQIPVDQLTVDGDTLVLKTKTPFSHLPAVLVDYASVILSPSSWGADGRVNRVIATGPFRITSIDGKTVIELERFDRYWGEKPNVARVRYTAIPNGDTRTNVAIAGDQDIIFTTAPAATPRIDAAGQMKVESLTIPRVRVLAFDSGLQHFSDVRVRRAINMVIDRRGIASAILRHPVSAST